MKNFAVAFVWNTKDGCDVQQYIDYATSLLTRDVDNPFSRNMDLPIFYYSNSKDNSVPPSICIDAEKVWAYVFIGKKSVISNEWKSYIQELVRQPGFYVVPIALDKYALKMPVINELNYIRLYEYEENKKQKFFISMAHEIYRYGFNYNPEETSEKTALKIFLSHTKEGCEGVNVAYQLKAVIDHSPFEGFFDTYDIAVGYRFDAEIEKNIKESSLIIVNSDKYSSRYWCQREILAAKEYERPMIEVDLIEKNMDRKFPYAGNIPVVRVDVHDGKIETDDLYRILECVLVETIRCLYADNKLSEYDCQSAKSVRRMHRPPEMFDLKKIVDFSKNGIVAQCDMILYPDPPIYSEEWEFYSNLGIKVQTPVEAQRYIKKKIGISISDPDEKSLWSIGQTERHLKNLAQTMAKYLLGCSATLVYGGDLRPDGFTWNIIMEARILKDKFKSKNIYLHNYIAWPIYLNETEILETFEAENVDVLNMIKVEIDETIEKLVASKDDFLPPSTVHNCYIWSRSLTEMRKSMIADCAARICAGGRGNGYKGKIPGVLEEILIAVEMKKPLYLLGGFGGIVHSVCEVIEGHDTPDILTLKWQMENNSGYKELLQYYEDNGEAVSYTKIADNIRKINLNNGLSKEENIRLFHTPYVDEAIYLVLKGLQSIMQ